MSIGRARTAEQIRHASRFVRRRESSNRAPKTCAHRAILQTVSVHSLRSILHAIRCSGTSAHCSAARSSPGRPNPTRSTSCGTSDQTSASATNSRSPSLPGSLPRGRGRRRRFPRSVPGFSTCEARAEPGAYKGCTCGVLETPSDPWPQAFAQLFMGHDTS